jgi:hypothetical protein
MMEAGVLFFLKLIEALRECFEIQTLKVFLAKRVHKLRGKPA